MGTLDQVGIVDRRRIFSEIEAAIPRREIPEDLKADSVTVRSFTIKARDGHDIPVRSYVSNASAPVHSRAVLIYLHAGGFLFGDLESGDLNCRVLAARLNLGVLNVGYRLAPEWPFPNGVNDSYDAVEWVSSLYRHFVQINQEDIFLLMILTGLCKCKRTPDGLSHQRLPRWRDLVWCKLRSSYCVHGS